jgi:hypothetical protein
MALVICFPILSRLPGFLKSIVIFLFQARQVFVIFFELFLGLYIGENVRALRWSAAFPHSK